MVKWPRLRHLQAYQNLDEYHLDVHNAAREAAIHFKNHDIARAEEELHRLEEASTQVLIY